MPVVDDTSEYAWKTARRPVLKSEMTNRVIYPDSALWGATPSLIESTGPAAREIAAIAEEVDGILGMKRAAA